MHDAAAEQAARLEGQDKDNQRQCDRQLQFAPDIRNEGAGKIFNDAYQHAADNGAVAGMLIAPVVFLEPNMMASILLYGFAGAVVGGKAI